MPQNQSRRLKRDDRQAEFAELSQLKAEVNSMHANAIAARDRTRHDREWAAHQNQAAAYAAVIKKIDSALKRLGNHEMRIEQ